MENKSLQIRKKSIFTKFVNFIKGIFSKKVEQETSVQVSTIEKQEVKFNNFFDEIRINKEEDKELLYLQNKYENNEIDLCLMSNEEVHELNSLYKRQVADLKKELDDKKAQLSIMKNRIKSYSVNA